MIKRNGFTLVELLAVIVILAIILAIAIPGISNVIASATRSSFESDIKIILNAIGYKMLENQAFDSTTVNEISLNNLLGLSSSNYETLTIKRVDGVLHAIIVGKGKWANLTASGTQTTSIVEDTVTGLSNGANKPVLIEGMTPIKWIPGTWVDEVWVPGTWVDTTATDTAWYNYDEIDKQWANARTKDGSMWVWIPRYIYKISTGWNLAEATGGTIDVQFSKGVDDNWNKAVIGNIDLGETSNASNKKWTYHPAFTFGDTELTGIWVAKFEASGEANTIDSKFNGIALRTISINDMFKATRAMETNSRYGWEKSSNMFDTHMMKNNEWGAVAYLTQSVYGKNTEVWVNNSSAHITGCAGGNASASSYPGCQYPYDTDNGQQASTTGTIYGIYDMSGGAWEFVAGYVNNSYADDNGLSLYSANNKYKNIYTVTTDDHATNYNNTLNQKGDAVFETSTAGGSTSWYGDFTGIPSKSLSWFLRGGSYNNGTLAGMFHFACEGGSAFVSFGFRPTVSARAGL